MKKALALMLVAMLMLSVCVVTASAETTTVKFWTHQNTAWNAAWEELITEFEAANPDIDIEYTTFPYADFEAKIQTSLMAGDPGADVYEAWGGWMLDFASAGALSEVPETFMADLLQDSYAPVLGTLKYDGKYYGAPLEFNAGYGGMVVNKKLFDQNGISYPTTWQEVLDVSKKVAVQNGDIMEMRGLEYAGNDTLFFNWLSMILQKGGKLFDDKGRLDFNNPIAADCMKELVSYVTEDHITNTDSLTGAQSVMEHGFVCMDECYMAINGPWIIADCEDTFGLTYGTDFEYIAQPPFVDGAEQKWVAETGWSMCVPKATKVADAAWKFVEFALQPDNLLKHNLACAQIPPRASVAKDPAYLEGMPAMKPVVDILDKAVYAGSYNTGVVKTYMAQMYISLCNNDGTYASVEDACKKLTDDINANVKYY